MKVNEKVLIKYANSATYDIDKKGWLLKKSESKNEFQKRYCILKGNLFYYFEKPTGEPIGCVILEGCRIELEEDNDHQHLFSFRIAFSPKTYKNYIFASDSQETTEKWMKVLSSCSIGHLRHILSEIQKQVDDLEQQEQSCRNQLSDNNSQEDYFSSKRINPFDEEDNIISLNERGSHKSHIKSTTCFSHGPSKQKL